MSDFGAVATQEQDFGLYGEVTVGAETARRLSKILGREVPVGERFDLGLLCSTDAGALLGEHVFSDPRLNADLYPDF